MPKTKTKKRYSLRPKEYDEVSVVDSGANQEAHVVLFKRDKGGSTVSTGTVEKRKTIRSCENGHLVSKSDDECLECGSEEITRSLLTVRKDDLPNESEDSDTEVDDGPDEDEADGDEGEEEIEDDDGEEEVEDPPVQKDANRGYPELGIPPRKKKKGRRVPQHDEEEDDTEMEKSLVAIDAANAASTLVGKLANIFSSGGSAKKISKAYEDSMVEFNTVLDTLHDSWLDGDSVSKSDDDGSDAIARLTAILKEGGAMPKAKVTRPQALDGLELPEDVKTYVATLEKSAGVGEEETEDIYKGLHPEIVSKLKKADELTEAAEVSKWEEIAKSYKHFPGDPVELAKSLRGLHDGNPVAFEEFKKTLDAAEYNLSQSNIFKQAGFTGHGGTEQDSKISKREKEAKELVEKGEYPTYEQAYVSLLGGNDYQESVQTDAN